MSRHGWKGKNEPEQVRAEAQEVRADQDGAQEVRTGQDGAQEVRTGSRNGPGQAQEGQRGLNGGRMGAAQEHKEQQAKEQRKCSETGSSPHYNASPRKGLC